MKVKIKLNDSIGSIEVFDDVEKLLHDHTKFRLTYWRLIDPELSQYVKEMHYKVYDLCDVDMLEVSQ